MSIDSVCRDPPLDVRRGAAVLGRRRRGRQPWRLLRRARSCRPPDRRPVQANARAVPAGLRVLARFAHGLERWRGTGRARVRLPGPARLARARSRVGAAAHRRRRRARPDARSLRSRVRTCSRWPGATRPAAIATRCAARTRRSISSSTGCGPNAARDSSTSGRCGCRVCRIHTCTCWKHRSPRTTPRRNHGSSIWRASWPISFARGSSTAARWPSSSPRTGSGNLVPKAGSSSRATSSSGPGFSPVITASRVRTSHLRPRPSSRFPKRTVSIRRRR